MSVDDYLGFSGGQGLRRAIELGPDQTVQELLLSGLRGRGGGGFRTGRKWETILDATGTTKYVVANGAEGEPGTFKDRMLFRLNPYQIVEGVAIAALTLAAAEAFICLKAKFEREVDRITLAVEEMQAAGLAGDIAITIVQGPDEYLFGEEKAMLEVIEGNAPLPRLLQPYEHGLFAVVPQMGWQATTTDPEADIQQIGSEPLPRYNPTLVNNVETLANVPRILANGAEWHRGMGTAESPGHVICTVVGDVAHAGVAEIELGTPLSEALDGIGGGPLPGRSVKGVFSGVANAVVPAEALATPISYEDMKAIGSGMGSGGFIVYDDTACMVDVAHTFSRFLWVESCGQCPACKFGSGEITAYLERILGPTSVDRDVKVIGARLQTVTDANRCYLPVEEREAVSSLLRTYADEFALHLENRPCPRRHHLPVPKIEDIADGVATYDLRQQRKQPDWTYLGEPGSGE
jgi:NADH:ubiquinone oxidoreductase subunit F (NADH-binding)